MEYPRIVYGFHGCGTEILDNINTGSDFIMSDNRYDWLGTGIYFWENDEERAMQWAEELVYNGKIQKPAVIGAKIDLRHCLDMTTQGAIDSVLKGYEFLKRRCKIAHEEIPQNRNVKNNNDWKDRRLDRAVINAVHEMNILYGYEQYDSVRGAFIEGKPIYRGAGFKDKTHIQLCIRNPECILEIYKIV